MDKGLILSAVVATLGVIFAVLVNWLPQRPQWVKPGALLASFLLIALLIVGFTVAKDSVLTDGQVRTDDQSSERPEPTTSGTIVPTTATSSQPTTPSTSTSTQESGVPPEPTGIVPKYLKDAYVSSNGVNAHAGLTILGEDYPNSLTIACTWESEYPSVFNATGYSKIEAMVGVDDASGQAEVQQDIPCEVTVTGPSKAIIWKETFLPSEPRRVVIPLNGAGRITFVCKLTRARDGYPHSGNYPLGFGDAVLT